MFDVCVSLCLCMSVFVSVCVCSKKKNVFFSQDDDKTKFSPPPPPLSLHLLLSNNFNPHIRYLPITCQLFFLLILISLILLFQHYEGRSENARTVKEYFIHHPCFLHQSIRAFYFLIEI